MTCAWLRPAAANNEIIIFLSLSVSAHCAYDFICFARIESALFSIYLYAIIINRSIIIIISIIDRAVVVALLYVDLMELPLLC